MSYVDISFESILRGLVSFVCRYLLGLSIFICVDSKGLLETILKRFRVHFHIFKVKRV